MSRAHGAGDATVVTQLRAFLREPTRHRPHYTHGRGVLEGGHHVFRFAQGKFPPGLMHDTPTRMREELREAAEAFIRQVCFWEGATHYQMLCAPPEAKREALKEHYHLLMALIHPDRSEGSPQPWPADWAQRTNRAYAVLSDDAQREAYDASLRAASPSPPYGAAAHHARPKAGRGRAGAKVSSLGARVAKAMIALSAVIATILLFEVALGDSGREYALFHGFSASPRVRADASGAERPRYIGSGVQPVRDSGSEPMTAADRSESKAFFAPLWRSLTAPATAALAVASRPPAAAPPPEPVVTASTANAAAPMAAVERARPLPAPARREEAPVEAPPARVEVAALAPARAAVPAAREDRLTSEEIETVVVRLIGYYEAGEADKLMSLVDDGEAGYWQNARMRQSYLDFFRATKQRRLSVDKLDWKNATGSAQARGAATVHAEYFDEPGTLERRIDVEMDIARRNGQPKITRLNLFPSAR